ncbi:MAG: hypothetical protein ACI837_003562 [Crocinitomicaceae bacterium]|jgi:hypothetical protein
MKKINSILVLAISIALLSCGGDAGSGTTIDFKSDGTFLKDFTHTSTNALKGGIVWNAKRTAQTIEIGVSNAATVEIGLYGGFDSPKKEGEAVIGFKLSGTLFDKGAEATLIKEGDVFKTGATDNVLSCTITMPDYKMAMFNGEPSGAVNEYEGTATITKLTDTMVEGTIDFKRVDGTSSITVNFSEAYTDNWTGKGFN